jgi:capsular polysaccharide transport system ATP-binding protein
MSVEFDCFLIDEGMSVGDHRFHQKCNIELFEKRSDRAMIIVAHQTDLIRAHCDHAAILEKGKLIVHDTVDSAIAAYEAL